MDKPTRIQRKRTKGWRMPDNTVSVTRPGKWGNPFDLRKGEHCWTAIAHGFRADKPGRIAASVAIYKAWVLNGKADHIDCGLAIEHRGKEMRVGSSPAVTAPAPPTLDEIREELAGKNLACFCPLDQPCHADVLLELANAPTSHREVEMMDWQPIETAPRDGTAVALCWMENGKVAESFAPMVWNQFAENPLYQRGKGIWACHAKSGELLFTWTESHPDGAPTHWMPLPPPTGE